VKDKNDYLALLDALEGMQIEAEDGEILGMHMDPGLTDSVIKSWERGHNTMLPPDLREFMRRWNGGGFFCLMLEPLENFDLNAPGLLAFHNWGNGDFDCVRFLDSGKSEMVFHNHETGEVTTIAASFAEWLQRAVDEMKKKGTLYHPMDYSAMTIEYEGLHKRVPYGPTKSPAKKKWWQFWK
jgi:hypothetical protein